MPPAFENLCRAFDVALRLLHPMMPFITEELWQRLGSRQTSIALSPFPAHDPSLIDEAAEKEMILLQDIIVNIRNMRAEMRVEARRKILVELYAADGDAARLSAQHRQAIERLANLSSLNLSSRPLATEGGAVRSLPDFALRIDLADALDAEAERPRLLREKQKLERELSSLEGQLGNQQFLAKAPEQVVKGMRLRKQEFSEQYEKVLETLQKLG